MIAIKLWHVWQVIWLLGFKILTLIYLGPWLCDQAPDRKLCSVPPFLCKDRPIRIILHLLPWMSFLVIFPGLRQSPEPQYAAGWAEVSPPTVHPGSVSLFSLFGIEKENLGFAVPFMPFGQLGLQRALLALLATNILLPQIRCQMIISFTWMEI